MADDGNPDAPVQPVSEPQTAPAPTTTPVAPVQDTFVQVPRDQMGEYGSDFHGVLGDAKVGRTLKAAGAEDLVRACNEAGIPVADMAQYLRDTGQTQAVEGQDQFGAATPTEPQGEAPMTRELIAEVMKTELDLRDSAQQDQMAEQAAQNFRMAALQAMGVPIPAAGEPVSPMTRAAWDALHNFTEQAQGAALDPYLSAAQRQAALDKPPTMAMLQEGQRLATFYMTDLRNEFNSAAASGQITIPGSTLGDGPAGQPAQKDVRDMTPEEEQAHTIERANLKLVAQGLAPIETW